MADGLLEGLLFQHRCGVALGRHRVRPGSKPFGLNPPERVSRPASGPRRSAAQAQTPWVSRHGSPSMDDPLLPSYRIDETAWTKPHGRNRMNQRMPRPEDVSHHHIGATVSTRYPSRWDDLRVPLGPQPGDL